MEISLRPDFPDDLAERINRLKQTEGITKTHMAVKAFEMYIDVKEGRSKLIPVNESNKPEARSAS